MTDDALMSLATLDLRDRLASGEVTAVALAKACLSRIEERETEIQAWVWLDPEDILQQAERCDRLRASGEATGPLHGLPVGVKDIIDTKGIPTRNGCRLDDGRVPPVDAEVVKRLKAAGAIIMGKTVTTELAFLHPGETRNPRNPEHTPGGSSSGSAAAVADGMVPLALGTQTGGSVVRPASFCGVVGFKATFGAISREGVLSQSHRLDTVGVFAQDIEGAALLSSILFERRDVDGMPTPNRTSETPPRLGYVQLPGWETADDALHNAFNALRSALGPVVAEARLPQVFDDVVRQRATINAAEMAHHFAWYYDKDPDTLGPETRASIERGRALSALDYLTACQVQDALAPDLDAHFARFDALLCPAALGPAPKGLTSTGDSIFNGLWTMAGTPAITLPLLTAPNGLPMGVQLVGAPGRDWDLLSVAAWLWDWAQANRA